jgi:hypothetical protein
MHHVITIALVLALGQAPLAGGEVIPILVGQQAPSSGLLVPELRFRNFLNQGLDLEACTLRLKVRDELLAESQGWWDRNKAPSMFVVGFALGLASTVLAILGARELSKVGTP